MTTIDWGPAPFDAEAVATFWSRVDQRGPQECWPWKGYLRGRPNAEGVQYGSFKSMNASRFVATLIAGRKLNGRAEQAMHSCDNPICCNPAHISIGSQSQNQRESVERNRHIHAKKSHCKWGHPYAGDNLFVRKNGMRECRTCMTASNHRRRSNG